MFLVGANTNNLRYNLQCFTCYGVVGCTNPLQEACPSLEGYYCYAIAISPSSIIGIETLIFEIMIDLQQNVWVVREVVQR